MKIKIKTRDKDRDGFSMSLEELEPIGDMVQSNDEDNSILAKGILSNVIITKEQVPEVLKKLEPESTPKDKYLAVNILENAKVNIYYTYIINKLLTNPNWILEGGYIRTKEDKFETNKAFDLPELDHFMNEYKKDNK